MSSFRLDLTISPEEEMSWRKRFHSVIKKYGKFTHFSYDELLALLVIYKKFTKVKPIDRLSFRTIMYTMFAFQNDVLMDRIFSTMDIHNKLALTMDSWIRGLSVILRGTLDEKIRFCFSVYNMMGEGYIKKEHMQYMLKHSIKSASFEEDHDEVLKEIIEIIMKKMDHDRDGKLSFEDYSKSVWENPDLLEVLGHCLPARPFIYMFMTTFTDRITTMHATMYKSKIRKPGKLTRRPYQSV